MVNANQLVPPSCVKAVIISVLFNVEVKVGAVFAGNLNEAGHVTVLAVPSAFSFNTNDDDLPEACVLLIVNVVIFAFKETSNTVATERSNVSVPALIVGAEFATPALITLSAFVDLL